MIEALLLMKNYMVLYRTLDKCVALETSLYEAYQRLDQVECN